MKIGYLGPEGTYSHAALVGYLTQQKRAAELVPFSSFPLLFEGYKKGACEQFILPLENSIEGPVAVNLDLLFSMSTCFVFSEIIYPISHCLMVSQAWDGSVEDIKKNITTILSYTQPLAQCRQYLLDHFSTIKTEVTGSTSQAAQLIQNSVGMACIGSESLADLYQLKVIDTEVNDYSDNATRFVMIGAKDAQPSGSDKTSIVFSALKDKPGSLVEILNMFSAENINLTKIESRPSKVALGEYIFYVDCEGHRLEDPLKTVLQKVEQNSAIYRCLGSYPKGG